MWRVLLALLFVTTACGSRVAAPTDAGAPPADGGTPAIDGGASIPDGGPADAGAGAWRRLADLPSPRQEIAAAVLGAHVYVVGGLDSSGRAIRDVVRIDGAGTAERRADYPFAVDHAAAAVVAGTLYVIGGSENFQPFSPERRVFAYDAGNDRWEARAPLPRGRWAPAAAVVGSKIYVGGGIGTSADEIYAYDATGNAWSTLTVRLTSRDHLAAAAAGGRVYFVGGRTASNTGALEELDPAGPAVRARTPMPTARGGLGAAELGGWLYVVGGEIFGAGSPPVENGVFPHVERYSPADDRWERVLDTPIPRHGLAVVSFGGALWVIGGATVNGVGASAAVEVYSP